MGTFFSAIGDRLRNPEWEVRQHALRVLTDIIPFVDTNALDTEVQSIWSDVIANLGHSWPAIRKAAVDVLKTYLKYSSRASNVLRELANKCIANGQENKVNSEVVLGAVIAIPFLISSNISDDTLGYIIHILLDHLRVCSQQESTVRALIRVKGFIGVDKFVKFVRGHELHVQFEMLCESFNIPEPNFRKVIGEAKTNEEDKRVVSDINQNVVDSNGESVAISVSAKHTNEPEKIIEDKVILETEISLDSGTAITMKIHEETKEAVRQEDIFESENGRG